jgi:hypothetical protein
LPSLIPHRCSTASILALGGNTNLAFEFDAIARQEEAVKGDRCPGLVRGTPVKPPQETALGKRETKFC